MTSQSTPHRHRCRECRERMDADCADQSCAEGLRWVVLCLICYERLIERNEAMW